MTLNEYLMLPWTVLREEHNDDGSYVALRIKELPGFVVAAETEEELDEMFWGALSAFLNSYIEDGISPPMPSSTLSQVEHPAFARPAQTQQASATRVNEVRTGANVSTRLETLALAGV